MTSLKTERNIPTDVPALNSGLDFGNLSKTTRPTFSLHRNQNERGVICHALSYLRAFKTTSFRERHSRPHDKARCTQIKAQIAPTSIKGPNDPIEQSKTASAHVL
jgi:hypothetical protein